MVDHRALRRDYLCVFARNAECAIDAVAPVCEELDVRAEEERVAGYAAAQGRAGEYESCFAAGGFGGESS